MIRLLCSFALVAILAVPAAAKADTITFTLAPSSQTAKPGSTLIFSGTITALSTNSGNEYLNGDSFTFAGSFPPDDSPFVNNAPFFLTPGQTFTGAIFDITVPANYNASIPLGGTFSILGGSTGSSQGVLATSNFQVNLTPEPSSLVLLGTGLLGVVGAARRKYLKP